jgi:hypothetical protein
LWFEDEPGLGEEPVDELGPVLDALEPVLDDGGELVHVAGGEVAQAILHVRPDTLGRVELGGVGRQPDLGQPAGVTADEHAHRGADVGVEVIPDQDDRRVQRRICKIVHLGAILWLLALSICTFAHLRSAD